MWQNVHVMSTTHPDWGSILDEHLGNSKKPLIVVLGSTACGKTDFSITLAKSIKGAEVVNADSRQLYRHMDIGTAKITETQMQEIPHHMLDVLKPDQESTSGWYQTEAKEIIDSIHKKGGVPILVGGSMLYISSIIDELSMAPETDQELRDKLMKEYDLDNGETLFNRLLNQDPIRASKLHKNNKPRLVRALEILKLSNPSDLEYKYELGSNKTETELDILIFGVRRERTDLVDRINSRAKLMIESGWIDEVKSLMDLGYTELDPGMKSHGYKEIMAYLKAEDPISLEKLTEKIAAKTRQYSKRQKTWWKGDTRINWIDL
jgi:tRNA dimethylallyltransferase